MKIKHTIREMQSILDDNDIKSGIKETIERFIQHAKEEGLSSDKIIELLNLIDLSAITNEEGFFSEFIKTDASNAKKDRTIIFYLIKELQVSCLHSLSVNEKWRWLGGRDIIISLLIEGEIREIILNEQNPSFTIEKGILFGSRISPVAIVEGEDNFALVTCECNPGFKPNFYSNPTEKELEILIHLYKKYIDKRTTIEKLIPKVQLEYFNELKPTSHMQLKFFLSDMPPEIPEKNGSNKNLMIKSPLSN